MGWAGLAGSFIWLINTNSTFINRLPDLLIVVVLGAIPGLISGLVQQPLIRWKFGTQIKRWWLWSIIGTTLGMGGFYIYTEFLERMIRPIVQMMSDFSPLLVPAPVIGVLFLLYSTAQVWALRHHVKRVWVWSLAAFVSASTLVFAASSMVNLNINGSFGTIFLGAFAGLAQGIVMALTLVWLFGMTRTEAAAQAYDTNRLQAKKKHDDENLQDAESPADAILVEHRKQQVMESEA